MSSTNYDVELDISYSDYYKHYIPTYSISVPYYKFEDIWQGSTHYRRYYYEAYISYDEGEEEHLTDNILVRYDYPLNPWYIVSQKSGIFNKIYIRNPNKFDVAFVTTNCHLLISYYTKANFEVQWNSTGFAPNQNAFFKCSTVWKNTYAQYEWTDATVYYKKTTDENYTSVSGTCSGNWSDVLISTNISLQDGHVYDVYVTATADDETTATTTVGQFSTTDAAAIATCISPSGAFISGDVTFVWSHRTEYGTPQYAYDLQYSNNNGSSWTTVANHVVTSNTSTTATLTDAGTYIWRVRTYNTNDVAGEWAQASFVNQVPANPPTNLQITTAGRPTVSWTSISQTAYQVQFLQNEAVVYDSGAVYTSETSHFVNQYFNDTQSYVVRVRIYNGLGEVSDWVQAGYQQPSTTDVNFTITANDDGGAIINITPSEDHVKYYILRNNKLIGEATNNTYTDKYAVGMTNYSVVGVTSADQSDIQTQGFNIVYPHATLIASDGQQFLVNKRVNNAYEIQTSNSAEIDKANFIGDKLPTHYPSDMRLKSFTISMFDDQGIAESLLGTLVFYADNFKNGGWCIVTAYDKSDNFIKNGQGVYANEVSLKLEVTNYDDSIEYPI